MFLRTLLRFPTRGCRNHNCRLLSRSIVSRSVVASGCNRTPRWLPGGEKLPGRGAQNLRNSARWPERRKDGSVLLLRARRSKSWIWATPRSVGCCRIMYRGMVGGFSVDCWRRCPPALGIAGEVGSRSSMRTALPKLDTSMAEEVRSQSNVMAEQSDSSIARCDRVGRLSYIQYIGTL